MFKIGDKIEIAHDTISTGGCYITIPKGTKGELSSPARHKPKHWNVLIDNIGGSSKMNLEIVESAFVVSTYFPLLIKLVKTGEHKIVKTPSEIPVGEDITVVETNCDKLPITLGDVEFGTKFREFGQVYIKTDGIPYQNKSDSYACANIGNGLITTFSKNHVLKEIVK